MNEKIRGPYAPQQYAGQPGARPPKGWVPPLGTVLQQIGVYDTETGYWVGLPLQALTEALAQAEQLHSFAVLDGREEDVDLQSLIISSGSAKGATKRGSLPKDGVPTGEVWFINAVEIVLPADAGGTPTANWRNSLWTARDGGDYGQAFHSSDLNFSPGGGTQWDEFTYPGNWWHPTNKPHPLRLPPGAKLTFEAILVDAAAAADLECICRIYGWVGKLLVG